MSREVILYITASLDGYIADTQGGVEWLHEAAADLGFSEFFDSVDTIIQGSHTYLDTVSLVAGDPYPGKENYVFTSREDLEVIGAAQLVHEDAVDFVTELKAGSGGRIWLVGGGLLASSLLSAGLIDEIDLFIQPVILGDGIALWSPPLTHCDLELLDTREWHQDLVELRYRVM